MSKPAKSKRFGAAKDARKKSAELWSSYVAQEHQERLERVLQKLNVEEIKDFNEILTSVYQCESRRQKQRDDHERRKKNRIENGNPP